MYLFYLQAEEAVASAVEEFKLQVRVVTGSKQLGQGTKKERQLLREVQVCKSCSCPLLLQGYSLEGIIMSSSGGNTDRCVVTLWGDR